MVKKELSVIIMDMITTTIGIINIKPVIDKTMRSRLDYDEEGSIKGIRKMKTVSITIHHIIVCVLSKLINYSYKSLSIIALLT